MRALIRRLLERWGYELTRIDDRPVGISAEPAVEREYFELLSTLRMREMPLDPDQATLYSLYGAVRYVIANSIPGDFVECGVGEGPKVALMAASLMRHGITDRSIYLYDTFTGLTEPSDKDFKFWGELSTPQAVRRKWESDPVWNATPLETVKANVEQTGYPPENLHYVVGDVRETIPNTSHDAIAILRLDTDFYDSSLHELRHLYDLVVPGGVVILDDYGGFAGQKSATDEFFAARGESPWLIRTSDQERVLVKVSSSS